MKKKHISTLLICASLSLGLIQLTSCRDEPTETQTFEFEKTLYEVSSGDAVTVKGNPSGVTYSFQGGTPEGVTLDSSTGVITFDEELDSLPETKYIAIKGDEQAITTIRFKTIEVIPTVTFKNVSKYIVSGDAIIAESKSDSGKVYAVSYALVEPVSGINIDTTSGVVTYNEQVKDGTTFKVSATSKSVTETFECIAMTEGIITSTTSSQIVEVNSGEDATFILNFNGNTLGDEETTSENFRIAINDTIQDANSEYYTYNAVTKTITLNSELLDTLGTGEINIKALTQRNAVSLNLIIADKFIYTADEFKTIFEPNYETETPSFKEGSLDGYYVLGSDIDLTSYLSEGGAGYNNGKGWLPIGAYSDGTYDVPFTGTFNGNGHTISGFFINDSKLFVGGLFGRNQGTIKNFTLKGSIESIGSWSGALVGNNGDMGIVENIILDVDLVNGGQYATGVAASTNWGTMRNIISINEEVYGYNEVEQEWQTAGIVVGLNEVSGKLSNIYGISKGLNTDGEEEEYGLFGYSQNSEVTSENAGKLFKSIDELKAFDFSKVIKDSIFNFKENEVPTLNVEFTPLSAGFIRMVNLPSFAFVGSEITLNVEILPNEYQAELESEVTYEVFGVTGATVTNNIIDLSKATVNDEGGVLEIKATLKVGNKTLTDVKTVNVYKEVTNVTITNEETSIDEGGVLEIKTSITPNITNADVSLNVEVESGSNWMLKPYVVVEGTTIRIDENIAPGLESIRVTATAYGVSSEPIVLGIKHYEKLPNNNVIHYLGEEDTYNFAMPKENTTIAKVELEGQELSSDQYIFENNTLKINPTLINTFPNTMCEIKITDGWGGIYKGFTTFANHEEYTEEYILENEEEVVTISSVEEFKSYFPLDGKFTDAHKENMTKTYMITNDLDFEGVNITPIGNVYDDEGNEVDTGEDDSYYFTGKIYGLGHTISNFASKGGSRAGLFRQFDGSVYDLNISGADVSGSWATGTLAAAISSGGYVENVNVTNSTITNPSEGIPGNTSGTNVGGIVGKTWTDGNFVYCTYNGFNIDLYVK